MKAVRIDVYGALTEEDLRTGEGAGFNWAVCGLVKAEAIERLAITSCWEIWVDEDGIAKQLPPSPAATALARQHGFAVTLYGTAVVTGVDADTDRATDPGTGRHDPGTALRPAPIFQTTIAVSGTHSLTRCGVAPTASTASKRPPSCSSPSTGSSAPTSPTDSSPSTTASPAGGR